MLAETKVGPRYAADGTTLELRSGRSGEGVVADAHGRYQEAASRGNVYFACNQAGIAIPVGLTTAAKNFTLYNPAGSGKNLVLLEITFAMTVQPSASPGAVMLVGNLTATQAAPATKTAETVRNALLGGPAGVGLVYNTTTLAATPVALRNICSIAWVTATVPTTISAVKDEVAGAIIIPPGIYVSVAATAACTAQFSMTWEEILI